MVAVYFGVGCLLFTKLFSNTLSPAQRYTIGALLLIYAIFRTFRIFINKNKDEDEKE